MARSGSAIRRSWRDKSVDSGFGGGVDTGRLATGRKRDRMAGGAESTTRHLAAIHDKRP